MIKKTLVLAAMLLVFAASGVNAGLTGYYYNLSDAHPDMETAITGRVTGLVQSTLSGNAPALTALGSSYINQFDWFDDAYLVGSRVDSDADLNGGFASSWFPSIANTGQSGDPYHFAVHWTGSFYVDEDKTYTYTMGSDDDSWLFIDDQLHGDLGGIHANTMTTFDVSLTQGWHEIDIFFAERHIVQSGFQLNFFSDLESEPIPEPATFLLVGLGLVGGIVRKRFLK